MNSDFISIGRSSNIERGSFLKVIHPQGILKDKIILKDYCWIGKNVEIQSVYDSEVVIDDYVSIQDRCKILGSVYIGKYAVLAPDIFISSGNHYYKEKPFLTIRQQDREKISSPDSFREYDKKIVVEEDCWIGKNVFIAPGVCVGRGAIIGTNSIVKKDIEPYSINVGTPLIKVKERLSFRPTKEISAFIPNNLPYFYRGFEHYVPELNILDVIADNSGIRSENRSFAVLEKSIWEELFIIGFAKNAGSLKIFVDGELYTNQVLEAQNEFKIKIDKSPIIDSNHSDCYTVVPEMIRNYLIVQFEFKSNDRNKYNFVISKISML